MMANPIYDQFGGQQNNNGFSAFMNDFRRLKQTVKNPRQEVERLLIQPITLSPLTVSTP